VLEKFLARPAVKRGLEIPKPVSNYSTAIPVDTLFAVKLSAGAFR
jgi:hypothetical protein